MHARPQPVTCLAESLTKTLTRTTRRTEPRKSSHDMSHGSCRSLFRVSCARVTCRYFRLGNCLTSAARDAVGSRGTLEDEIVP